MMTKLAVIPAPLSVIPAQAGIHDGAHSAASDLPPAWIPACAGMTGKKGDGFGMAVRASVTGQSE